MAKRKQAAATTETEGAVAVRGEAAVAPTGAYRVAPGLEAFLVPVGDLEQDPRNARIHPERNLAAIKASLEQFGQRKPIVVRKGFVLAGNGQLEAARALGWTHLAVVDAGDLTPTQAKAFSLADNRSGELAEWDYAILGSLVGDLKGDGFDVALVGFSDEEMDKLYPTLVIDSPAVGSGGNDASLRSCPKCGFQWVP